MTAQEIYDYCLTLEDVYPDIPFGEGTLVFRHRKSKKIFLFFMNHYSESDVALKGDPLKNAVLRQSHAHVKVGYHLNKKHWINIITEFAENGWLTALIDESYALTKK